MIFRKVLTGTKIITTGHDYIVLCLFYFTMFQYILRKKRMRFGEISIGLNFTSLTRNDEKSDFLTLKMGGGGGGTLKRVGF